MRPKIQKFPVVLKERKGLNIVIINKKSVTQYNQRGITHYTKSDIDSENPDAYWDYQDIFGKGWNAYNEVEMWLNNGYEFLHPKENISFDDDE